MKRSWGRSTFWVGFVSALLLPLSASALDRPHEEAVRGWHLIEWELKLDTPAPRYDLRAIPQELQEQLIGVMPGETFETLVRHLTERRLELRFSSRRAFVLFRMPLG